MSNGHLKTLEDCQKSAKKYSTRLEWQKNDRKYYSYAHRHGWLEQCCSHMSYVRGRPRTKESVFASAMKYDSIFEWRKNDHASYQYAHTYGWYEELSKHMINSRGISRTLKECQESAKSYKTVRDWKKTEPALYAYVGRHGWLNQCCEHMEPAPGSSFNAKKPAFLYLLKIVKAKKTYMAYGITNNLEHRLKQHKWNLHAQDFKFQLIKSQLFKSGYKARETENLISKIIRDNQLRSPIDVEGFRRECASYKALNLVNNLNSLIE